MRLLKIFFNLRNTPSNLAALVEQFIASDARGIQS